ncbi:DUF3817 domain-containing protein [Chryseobacterium suipulveris]|uniref:DUF3817 domain-containing protein n=1 Tax=Chryseobacterium suipulveris TaxID=2929800 RepID=A0ABY4BUP5_9FLAO|nr:DUF3817 domain-containing protein [Chryseobacterium suipulveris]UOE41426.1 DUF3817 domain-containing protein [Chryseobacterium suipulveris]
MEFVDKLINKYSEEKITDWFKKVCTLEAISWCLLFSAMIWIRYDREGLLPTIYIIIMGNLHGLFFTLYLILVLPARKIFKWDDEDFVFALIAAFFPFATIWVEKKLARFDRE